MLQARVPTQAAVAPLVVQKAEVLGLLCEGFGQGPVCEIRKFYHAALSSLCE